MKSKKDLNDLFCFTNIKISQFKTDILTPKLFFNVFSFDFKHTILLNFVVSW